jgi:hypothetical protein
VTGKKRPVVEKCHRYLVFKDRNCGRGSRYNLAKQAFFATGFQQMRFFTPY